MRPIMKAASRTARSAVELFFAKNSFQGSAALAFYTLFSIAPLLLIVVTISGSFLGEEIVRAEVISQMQRLVGQDAAELVGEAMRRSRVSRSGLLPTLIGVSGVIFGATTVLAQLRTSLNDFWDVRAQPMRSDIANFLLTRLLSVGMLLTIGFLLLASLLVTIALGAMLEYADGWFPLPDAVVAIANAAASLVVVTAMFAMLLRVLPDVGLTWRDVGQSALVTGVLFLVGQSLISMYVTRVGPTSPYGAAGALMVILLWVYYSALLVYLGTAIARSILEGQGRAVEPTRGAVRIQTVVVNPETAEEL